MVSTAAENLPIPDSFYPYTRAGWQKGDPDILSAKEIGDVIKAARAHDENFAFDVDVLEYVLFNDWYYEPGGRSNPTAAFFLDELRVEEQKYGRGTSRRPYYSAFFDETTPSLYCLLESILQHRDRVSVYALTFLHETHHVPLDPSLWRCSPFRSTDVSEICALPEYLVQHQCPFPVGCPVYECFEVGQLVYMNLLSSVNRFAGEVGMSDADVPMVTGLLDRLVLAGADRPSFASLCSRAPPALVAYLRESGVATQQ